MKKKKDKFKKSLRNIKYDPEWKYSFIIIYLWLKSKSLRSFEIFKRKIGNDFL